MVARGNAWHKRAVRLGWFVGTALLSMSPAAAQDLPAVDAGSLLRQSEQGSQQLPRELPTRSAAEPVPALTAGHGETVLIKAVRFTGDAALLPAEERAALAAAALGKPLDFDGMKVLAARVTRTLKQRGWLLARAYLPQQDVTAGELTIGILAGHLDGKGAPYRVQAAVSGSLRVSERRLERMVRAQVPPGSAVMESALTRAVLLMNDLPGVTARAALEPGDEPGSTRVVIGAGQAAVWHPGVSLNTMGSDGTGRMQVTASLGLDDPFGWGDRWNGAIVRSQGLSVQSLGLALPIGYRGLQLTAGHSWLDYRAVAGDAKDAGLSGKASTTRTSLSYPLIRSVRANLRMEAGYTHEFARDDIRAGAFNRKRGDTVSFALSGDFADDIGGGARTFWTLRPIWGSLNASLIATRGLRDSGFDSYRITGQFAKLGFQFTRLQHLAPRTMLSFNLQGQVTGKNMDSSQKFFPGGPSGVRAYPSSEATADSGVLTQLELRYVPDLGRTWGQLQVSAFHDMAWVRLHHRTMGLPIDTVSGANSYRIGGAGLSAALNLKAGGFLRATWATPIGRNPGLSPAAAKGGSPMGPSRLWLEGGIQF